jgi:hypothetical protein
MRAHARYAKRHVVADKLSHVPDTFGEYPGDLGWFKMTTPLETDAASCDTTHVSSKCLHN